MAERRIFRPLGAMIGACAAAGVLAAGLVSAPVSGPAFAAEPRVAGPLVIGTTEWAPYTSDPLPDQGAVAAVLKAAFRARGHVAVVRFWPWKRAIHKAWKGTDGVLGYFPAYNCRHEPRADFVISDPIGDAPLGFAHRAGEPMKRWNTIGDLRGERIGYVTGYQSIAAFDAAENLGIINVIRTGDDIVNLKNLKDGIVNLALVDKFIFRFLSTTHPLLTGPGPAMRFHQKPLDIRQLYLCLRADGGGRALMDDFNAGLKAIDARAIMDRYIVGLMGAAK